MRVLLDGVGSDVLAEALRDPLITRGRTPVHVRDTDYLRPAGERFTWGREDPQARREVWLDEAGLRREVLDAAVHGAVLPALWDAERERSARAAPVPVPDHGVVLVSGRLLLGRALPAELTVHLTCSPAALLRRGVPAWELPAFAAYDEQVQPVEVCDVLVRAEDPQRPAVRLG